MNQINFNAKFRKETKALAIDIIRLAKTFPNSEEGRVIKKQLLRSATSVAANFRAVCRARSVKEKYAKLSIVVEEADESLFWIEIIEEAKLMPFPLSTKERALIIIKTMSSYRKKIKMSL